MATKAQRKYWNSLKGKKPKNMEGLSLGHGWNKNKKLSLTHRKNLSISHKGKIPPNKGKRWSIENRMKVSGKKRYNWKGGVTKEYKKVRKSVEYKLWRESVYNRDRFTCQKYGIVGGVLRAHHILNFSTHPELRFAIDNGITLSDRAHKEFHKKYGLTNNTREQLMEFLQK